jgi:hypothetical protein
VSQRVLSNIVARKYLPVDTEIYVQNTLTKAKPEIRKRKRKIDPELLDQKEICRVTDAIEEGNIDEAQTILQDTIKSAIVPNTLPNLRHIYGNMQRHESSINAH